jgi:hypothetical protein
MRTTHRRTWKKERWLIVDERTGATHYADEMVREPDTGLVVHQRGGDPKHPQLRIRPKYKDPAPVTPVIPAIMTVLVSGSFETDLAGLIGSTTIERCGPAASDHIFGTGIEKMVIEGCNEGARFIVETKDSTAGKYFDDQFP